MERMILWIAIMLLMGVWISDGQIAPKCKDCSPNATCKIEFIGGTCQFQFVCKCKAGFTGDGKTCTDVNECDVKTVCENAVCKNTRGSYECLCSSGYQYNDSTHKCEDIDECKVSSQCHSNATCTNTVGSFTCTCNNGLAGDGINICKGKTSTTTMRPTTTESRFKTFTRKQFIQPPKAFTNEVDRHYFIGAWKLTLEGAYSNHYENQGYIVKSSKCVHTGESIYECKIVTEISRIKRSISSVRQKEKLLKRVRRQELDPNKLKDKFKKVTNTTSINDVINEGIDNNTDKLVVDQVNNANGTLHISDSVKSADGVNVAPFTDPPTSTTTSAMQTSKLTHPTITSTVSKAEIFTKLLETSLSTITAQSTIAPKTLISTSRSSLTTETSASTGQPDTTTISTSHSPSSTKISTTAVQPSTMTSVVSKANASTATTTISTSHSPSPTEIVTAPVTSTTYSPQTKTTKSSGEKSNVQVYRVKATVTLSFNNPLVRQIYAGGMIRVLLDYFSNVSLASFNMMWYQTLNDNTLSIFYTVNYVTQSQSRWKRALPDFQQFETQFTENLKVMLKSASNDAAFAAKLAKIGEDENGQTDSTDAMKLGSNSNVSVGSGVRKILQENSARLEVQVVNLTPTQAPPTTAPSTSSYTCTANNCIHGKCESNKCVCSLGWDKEKCDTLHRDSTIIIVVFTSVFGLGTFIGISVYVYKKSNKNLNPKISDELKDGGTKLESLKTENCSRTAGIVNSTNTTEEPPNDHAIEGGNIGEPNILTTFSPPSEKKS